MRHALLLLVLSGAACTSFDTLDRNVCGNGLIEPGEDCDSSEASCVRCAITCDAQTDCPNAAYACGTDGLCHAPGGTLAAPSSAGPFQVNDYRITDIGGDGAGDVVGLSRTSIVVRDGDPSGILSTGVSLVTPFQTGRPAFGDLDGDGSVDITMTTPDGLVSYTSPLGQLTPLPVSSRLGEGDGTLELIGLYRVSNGALGAFLATQDDRLLIAVFDLDNAAFDKVVLPCDQNFRASTFSEAVYDVNRFVESDTASEMLLSINAPTTAGGVRNCVLSIGKKTNQMASITELTPATATAGVFGRAVMPDLDYDNDTCPGLLVANAAGAMRYYDGSRVAGACTIGAGASTFAPSNMTPGATLVTRFPLTPNIAGLTTDAVVMSDGVYVQVIVLGVLKVYSSTRKIARADYGDIDGNGTIDGVVASEGEDDIDILYRPSDAAGYQLVRLDTASRISSLTIGDYDGNGIADIAYTELIDQYQRLEVAFCTADRPLDPVAVGAFPGNISVVKLQIADSVDQLARAADLAVLSLKAGPRPPTVTLLHGSPQRTMLPYFDPSPTPTGTDPRPPYQFRGAVVGRFAGDDALADIAGVAIPTPNNDFPANRSSHAWVMRGTSIGPDGTETAGKSIMGMTDCAKSTATNDVCIDNTLYVTVPVGNRDAVIAIDHSDPARAGSTDPTSVNQNLTVTAAPSVTAGVPGGSIAHSAYTFGDAAAPELLVAFAPRAGSTGKGAIRTCALASGVPVACDDLTSAILDKVDGATSCIDAAPGRIHYRDPFSAEADAMEIIVLCRGGGVSMLERVTKTTDGVLVEELSRVPEVLESLRVGDVTGDGIDDVAAIANDHGAQTLEVFRQCSSRDANVCRGGGL